MKRIAITAALLACACSKPAEQSQANAVTQQLKPAEEAAAVVPNETGEPAAPANSGASAASPCLTQDDKSVPKNSIRAFGTEPFWGASVEGRCVTYSHPEDQDGTRIWTRFTGSAENGRWQGALDGKPFVMVTRSQPGCSDGMSDNRYPIAVDLMVGGEQRKGCARPD